LLNPALCPAGFGAGPGKGISFEEHCREEALDLADATAFLLETVAWHAKAGGQMEEVTSRLLKELVSSCRVSDRFSRVLTQRVHMLQCIHQAWRRTYQRREKGLARLAAGAGASRATNPAGEQGLRAAVLPRDVTLAIDILFSLLAVVHDANCPPEQCREFVDEISPVLRELPALCLAGPASAHDSGEPQTHHMIRAPHQCVRN
jgi:hypothetical protein